MKITEKPKKDSRYYPSAEYRFWLYDPDGSGMTFFRDKDARDSFANEAISNYLDSDTGWFEDVDKVCAGEVELTAQVINKTMRPDDSGLDEDEYDEDGVSWADGMEWRGTYKLEPIGELK